MQEGEQGALSGAPDVRKALGRKEPAELGAAIEKAKKVPRRRVGRPGVRSGRSGLVAGTASAVVDKAKAKVKQKVGSK